MTQRSIAARLGATMVAVLTTAATAVACTNEPDKAAAPPASSSSSAAPPAEHRACQAALPAAWQQAIEGSRVEAGGSTMPLAVGRSGEVVAIRDNGNTRDLLLIGADKSVKEIYAVPDPNRNNVGFAAIDDRWIVVGVDRIPRNSNGVLPTLTQIDLIDRKGGPVRTVVQDNDDDFRTDGPTIDSVALFDGKVYWITHEKYASRNGVTRSYDVNTGAVAEVGSGTKSGLQATAAGLTDENVGGRGLPTATMWEHAEVTMPAKLPPPVADFVGAGPDRLSLATDGTAYAWLTGVDHSVTGVAWWSPQSGVVRISGDIVHVTDVLPAVWVVGPYVVIGMSEQAPDAATTVVDTRSGAVANLKPSVVGADGGTIGLSVQHGPGGKMAPFYPVVLRTEQLPPLTC